MLLDFDEMCAKYDLEEEVLGVLHIGAHLAEEAPFYAKHNINPVWWVEANPAVREKIMAAIEPYPEQQLLIALVYSQTGLMLPFNVTNYDGMSSSIFEFGTHPQFSPDTVFESELSLKTWTIDNIVEICDISANFLVMDIQGAELHALQGADVFLDGVEFVMSEVNQEEVYKGCAKVWELDELLGRYGLKRVETNWVPGQGWGDALWVK